MKEKIFNLVLAFLFSLTFFFVVISLTVLNEKYIFKILSKEKYYEKLTFEINDSLLNHGIDYHFDIKIIKKDLNNYVKNRYTYKQIDCDSEEIAEIYNSFILFAGKNKYREYSYIIYAVTIILLILTGNIFLKSKKQHNLANVFIISFFILLSIYACIYFLVNNNDLINMIILKTNYIILASSIILLEIGIYKKVKIKI